MTNAFVVEISVYSVDGDIYVKKRGDGRLISINKDYPDIVISETARTVCFGKYMGKVDGKYFV